LNGLKISSSTVQHLMELSFALFFAILFLQSGLDKLLDRSGNQAYLSNYFGKSPLKGLTPVLFVALTVLEVLTGVLSALGFLQILFAERSVLAL
jgi:uncharacterized membrane protein YphA (DoxX/SURF4 family)